MLKISRFKLQDRRGFTLTEFLIVIAIVAILSTIGLINLYGRNKSERFNSALVKLVGTINEAVDNSKTLKDIPVDNSLNNFVHWGVNFTPSWCSGGPGYSLALRVPSETNYGQFVLPDGVDFDPSGTPGLPTSPSCSVKRISFNKFTGVPSDLPKAKVKIYLIDNPEVSSTISISPLGQVTFTSDDQSLNR